MSRRKLNCWEFQKCGREEGGERTAELGVCPAAIENKLDAVHDGKHAGRACWVVSGTLCGGDLQGTFAKKFKNCEICDFYNMVKKEEEGNFQLSALLLYVMRPGMFGQGGPVTL